MSAEKKSFSKAAEALYITPSAVIQQINHLERDLQVQLFIRTRHSLTLTEAGTFLFREGADFIAHSRAIRRQLSEIARREQNEIWVGTCLLQKTRLFYELWSQFQGEQRGYSVRVQHLNSLSAEYNQVDLIEGILDGSPWQRNLNFLPLCAVPLACAVPKGHPLSDRRLLTYEDLRSATLVTIHSGMCETLDRLIADAVSHEIHILEVPRYDLSVFAMCLMNGYIMQTPFCWRDIHPNLTPIPCEWGYELPYGIHYRKDAAAPVISFLKFAEEYMQSATLRLY